MRNPSSGKEEHHEQHKRQRPRMVGMGESCQSRDEAASRRQRLLLPGPGDNGARNRDGDHGLHDVGRRRLSCLDLGRKMRDVDEQRKKSARTWDGRDGAGLWPLDPSLAGRALMSARAIIGAGVWHVRSCPSWRRHCLSNSLINNMISNFLWPKPLTYKTEISKLRQDPVSQ